MVKKLKISHFKSIKDLELDCRKINLFVGKPNVGKSNILEALSLFQTEGEPHIRFEDMRNLFYDQDVREGISIALDNFGIVNVFNSKKNEYAKAIFKGKNFSKTVDEFSLVESATHLKVENKDPARFFGANAPNIISTKTYKINGGFLGHSFNDLNVIPPVKQYIYKKDRNWDAILPETKDILAAPYGENLFDILKNNRPLLREVSDLFEEYGYGLVIDFISNQAEIQKIVGNVSYKIPYSLVADTLQRVIFYLIAIKSNKGCSILLEEPESHSFPPFIRRIALEIIESDNQYFIATHSPYLLNTIISDAPKEDVAVNVVTYSDYQTKVKTLSDEEVSELSDYGIDIFFNLNLFV